MDNQPGQSITLNSGLSRKIIGILESKPVILQFLKFAGIGFLTTAVDFLLLNLISKYLSISVGLKLGGINIFTFAIALAHSYVWNGNWTFGIGDGISAIKSFWRTVLIGFIGVTGIILAVVGGRAQANPLYYLLILGVLAAAEVVIWKSFALGWFERGENTAVHTVFAFAAVSIIGALINSGLVGLITNYWLVTPNLDLNKNIAKVIATAISLFWNFVGYKLFVFKK